MKRTGAWLLGIVTLVLGPAMADASSITFEGTRVDGGYHYDATATFAVSGNNLVVTLTNTATDDVLIPIEVLTGMFFHTTDPVTLGKVSVVINSGSTVLFAPVGGSGPAVGGEWAYVNGLNVYGLDLGISSSGLGLFGPGNVFPPGTNLQGPGSPDGLQYGITAAGDNPATGNTPVTGTNALIKNSVVITFALDPGVAATFDPAQAITDVVFQYGTALSDGHTDGGCIEGCEPLYTAEPGTIFLFSGCSPRS